ncbi:hypothetical protein [Sulfurimonas sp.]|uniref:hypothetical protein n=1 Tax=Sulfurimonas sp. TaxID=2022749 RepID=UPI0025E673D2|nr:hypothetical protein [Sulfurimonas sp.]
MNKDFENTINSEDVEFKVVDKLKGIYVLIEGLVFMEESGAGDSIYQRQAYEAINTILSVAIKNAVGTQELVAMLENKITKLEKTK